MERDNPCAISDRQLETVIESTLHGAQVKSKNGVWADRVIVGAVMALGAIWAQNLTTQIKDNQDALSAQIEKRVEGDAALASRVAEIRALQLEVMRRLRDVEQEDKEQYRR